jgi:hypothetical protein
VNNIKMNLEEIGWGGMDLIDLVQDEDPWRALVHGIEPTFFKKFYKIVDWLHNWRFLKKDSAPWGLSSFPLFCSVASLLQKQKLSPQVRAKYGIQKRECCHLDNYGSDKDNLFNLWAVLAERFKSAVMRTSVLMTTDDCHRECLRTAIVNGSWLQRGGRALRLPTAKLPALSPYVLSPSSGT